MPGAAEPQPKKNFSTTDGRQTSSCLICVHPCLSVVKNLLKNTQLLDIALQGITQALEGDRIINKNQRRPVPMILSRHDSVEFLI